MSQLFDIITNFLVDDVFELLVCGVGRLILRMFGRRLKISSRHEDVWIVGTGVLFWLCLATVIWLILR